MKTRVYYTVIAKSIPEYSKKYGGLFTCTLGYCHQSNSIIRVYPVPIIGMEKWHTYSIEIEKNAKDTREESWKLTSNSKFENWQNFGSDVIELGKIKRQKGIFTLMKTSQILPSIQIANNQKLSIAIVPILNYRLYWETNNRFINTNQLGLFEDVEIADWASFTKDSKEREARIDFYGNDGHHNLQYNDWGPAEWYRRHRGQYPIDQAFRFLLNKSYALIGNMHNYRNNWIVLDLY
jgi:hypothetical protein